MAFAGGSVPFLFPYRFNASQHKAFEGVLRPALDPAALPVATLERAKIRMLLSGICRIVSSGW